MVAVFGSQSTGKSTLLNGVFGTDFDVMDETKRQQTTRGIWMSRGKDMNVMVMDVEGTDGRERGEDQDFERKAALFSLASSEILIMNLWEHQVGLYLGANMGLLKTVFEVNLALFGKKTPDGRNPRTLLLFVIRDHSGMTPLANLQDILTEDMQRIWKSLSKPTELQECQISDYFDLSFTALPHKIWAADKFELEVRELRKRFVEKKRADYVFMPAYHKHIPSDGVSFYLEGIWEQVQMNKDLDLPTQQELLAQFRCDEISAAALAEFVEQGKPQRRLIEAGKVVAELGFMMRSWRTCALALYDHDAARYHPGVYKRRRAALIGVLDSTLSPLFLGQLKNLQKSSLVQFIQKMHKGVSDKDCNFGEVVQQAREACEKAFMEGAKDAVPVEGEEAIHWGYDQELDLLREEIGSVVDQCRKNATMKICSDIERDFKRQICEPLNLHLGRPTPDMWDKVLVAFHDTLGAAESMYHAKTQSFACTEAENATALATVCWRAWIALRAKVDEQTADPSLLAILRTHFEERFRYDEEMIPRVWTPRDDIDKVFKKARDETLALLPLYSKILPINGSLFTTLPPPPTEDDLNFPSTVVVLPETKVLDLISHFRVDADAFYVEAKRGVVSSTTQAPSWMYVALAALGYNEAVLVLSFFSWPVTVFWLIISGFVYIMQTLGLIRPANQVARNMGAEVVRQARVRLPAVQLPIFLQSFRDHARRAEDTNAVMGGN